MRADRTEAAPDSIWRCLKCQSPEVRLLSAVHAQGVTLTESSTIGAGVGTRGAALGGAITSGSQSSLFAKLAAPPQKRPVPQSVSSKYGCAALIALPIGIPAVASMLGERRVGPEHYLISTLLFVAVFGLMLFVNGSKDARDIAEAEAYNRDDWVRLDRAWRRSLICLRCGTIADPGESVG